MSHFATRKTARKYVVNFSSQLPVQLQYNIWNVGLRWILAVNVKALLTSTTRVTSALSHRGSFTFSWQESQERFLLNQGLAATPNCYKGQQSALQFSVWIQRKCSLKKDCFWIPFQLPLQSLKPNQLKSVLITYDDLRVCRRTIEDFSSYLSYDHWLIEVWLVSQQKWNFLIPPGNEGM